MSLFGEPKTDKPSTFNLMQALDIRRAIVEFSGGNDEGGVDGFYVFRGDQEIEGSLGSEGREGELEDLLGRPVYDEYSTFAGEFYVDGRVIWDLKTRTVVMRGDERVDSYEGFQKEL